MLLSEYSTENVAIKTDNWGKDKINDIEKNPEKLRSLDDEIEKVEAEGKEDSFTLVDELPRAVEEQQQISDEETNESNSKVSEHINESYEQNQKSSASSN